MISRIETRDGAILWAGVAALISLPVLMLSADAYGSYLAAGSLLLIGLIGLLATLHHPTWGLTLLLIACLTSPFEVGPVPAAAVLVAFLTLGFSLKVFLFHQRLEVSRPVVPLIAFVFVASLSFVSGQFPWFPTAPASLNAQLGGLAIFWLSAFTFLLTAYQIRNPASLRKMTWLFLIVGGCILLAYLLPGGHTIINLMGGSMGSLFWIWYISLALGQAVFNPYLQRWSRCLLIGMALFALAFRVFAVTSSVSGWLPCIFAVLVLLVIGRPKLALTASLLVGLVVIFHLEAIVETVWMKEQYSLTTRWEALKTLLNVIKSNPILGLGPANYYFYTELFPLSGWYVKFNSHNNYLDILAQTGIAGVACFFWFALEVGRTGWKLLTRLAPGFELAFTYGALAGLAGTLASGVLGDWIIPFVYNVGLSGLNVSLLGWFFLGGLVAIDQMRNLGRVQSAQVTPVRLEPGHRFARAGHSSVR